MTHEQLKRLVNDCTYSEDGITYMSDKQFNNMSDYINELKVDNVKLGRVINKAIEYIKENGILDLNGYDLLNILERSEE